MRILIYISGILGLLLLTIRVAGIYLEIPLADLFLYSGLALLGLVFLPTYIIDRIIRNRKINRIIREFQEQETKKEKAIESGTTTKGWGMNDSPFRTRKSGLAWSGGNVHAANAARGTRKAFLNKSQ
jgi:hypothetical protein